MTYQPADLGQLLVPELEDIAQAYGLTLRTKKTKQELITFILENQ